MRVVHRSTPLFLSAVVCDEGSPLLSPPWSHSALHCFLIQPLNHQSADASLCCFSRGAAEAQSAFQTAPAKPEPPQPLFLSRLSRSFSSSASSAKGKRGGKRRAHPDLVSRIIPGLFHLSGSGTSRESPCPCSPFSSYTADRAFSRSDWSAGHHRPLCECSGRGTFNCRCVLHIYSQCVYHSMAKNRLSGPEACPSMEHTIHGRSSKEVHFSHDSLSTHCVNQLIAEQPGENCTRPLSPLFLSYIHRAAPPSVYLSLDAL